MEPIVITSTQGLSHTLVYTLPTTGDVVGYERIVTSGDILIATPVWILVIIVLFLIVYLAARGRL